MYINYIWVNVYKLFVLFFEKDVSFTLFFLYLTQRHRSITLLVSWGCLCGKDMHFGRIKGVPFMRCISTHKWIWSRLCGRRVMRRHTASQTNTVQCVTVFTTYMTRTILSSTSFDVCRSWYKHSNLFLLDA